MQTSYLDTPSYKLDDALPFLLTHDGRTAGVGVWAESRASHMCALDLALAKVD